MSSRRPTSTAAATPTPNRRAKTPLPVLPKTARRTEIAVATQKRRRARAADAGAADARCEPRRRRAVAPAPTEANEQSELPTGNELMQRTLEAMRLEAQIAKDMDAYQKRPKRRFVGARAEEYRFARYVEDWRLKIERVGNLNYPEAARAAEALRQPAAHRVDPQRRHASRTWTSCAVVGQSHPRRRRGARSCEMSRPFAPFPPDIKRDTDMLHITRTWSFTKATRSHRVARALRDARTACGHREAGPRA